jgi:hypothetical protein
VAFLLGQGFGWPIIFIIGGVFPLLLLLLITALWLPESARSQQSCHQAAIWGQVRMGMRLSMSSS